MLTRFGHIARNRARQSIFKKKGSVRQVWSCRELLKLNFCNQVKFWKAKRTLTHADPFWSHYSIFELGRAALEKRVLFDRSGPVANCQNRTFATM